MDAAVDTAFVSSVNSLTEELDLLGIDNDIPTVSLSLACQSLLRTAWNLVQFIHCHSVGSSKSTFLDERERRLRDEMQQTQNELQRCKAKVADKEHEIKSLEQTLRKLRADSKLLEDEKEVLRLKVKSLNAKLENSNLLYKKDLSAQAVECDKLRDRLRNKIGLARRMSDQTECLVADIEQISLSKSSKRTLDDKLRVAQETIINLTTNNQTLVSENLWMRDTFARLYKHLDDVRIEGLSILKNMGMGEIPALPDKAEYPHSVFNQPLSLAIEKLRNLGEAQIKVIMNILRLIKDCSRTL